MPKQAHETASAEFRGAKLPDRRLNRRLELIADAAEEAPGASLPKMMGGEAEREAAYRFLSNARVEFNAVLQPHLDRTVERSVAAGSVLAIHDTSTFKLEGSRGGELGFINTGARGFFLHTTLAVENTEERRCLGVLKATTLFRETIRKSSSQHASGAECAAMSERESSRWWDHMSAVQTGLAPKCSVIHVADSEADSFTLLSNLIRTSCRFVIRMARDRRSRADETYPWKLVSTTVGKADNIAEREVPLSARGSHRPPKTQKKFPARDARCARLRFAAMSIQLKRPPYLDEPFPPTLSVNAVRVYEVDAPAGTDPVEWVLFTTEPVSTRDEVLAVVDIYRRRWVIEEFFRAVKTGCAYEERQLEGRHAWMLALAISLPLAWRLLQLKQVARRDPNRPASTEFTATEISVLRHLRPRLSPAPTVREAMLAIAEIGGHVKNNGEPGWLVLHRGLSKLQSLTEGVELAQRMRMALHPPTM